MPLSILAVDDELPALNELSYLLAQCDLTREVVAVPSATDALRQLRDGAFDVVFADVRMPGLDGLDLARVLARFADPPSVVFVTAHEQHALDAFDAGAVGYLLKPVTRDRLERLLARVAQDRRHPPPGTNLEMGAIPVEVGGGTRFVSHTEVHWVEAAGDYVRVHLRDGHSHLVRMSMSALEEGWSDHGFARVHRGYLVALREIKELRTDESGTTVVVGDQVIPVSRRNLRDLRDRMVGHARRATR